MTLKDIAPERSERLFCVGQTGTGKTTLVEKLVPLYPYVLINDSKGEFGGPKGVPGCELVTSLRAMAKSRSNIIQVRLPIKAQTEEAWEQFYGWAFECERWMIVTDELTMVMDGSTVPDGFRACACQGRSKGIGMINCTQRPSRIPLVARSEAQRYVAFEMLLRDDRKSVGEFMGEQVVDAPAVGHNFYYFSKHERRLHYLRLNLQGG